ncbi:hypothetical protein Hanom_Chr14g01320631 [Helianthus anomalus]
MYNVRNHRTLIRNKLKYVRTVRNYTETQSISLKQTGFQLNLIKSVRNEQYLILNKSNRSEFVRNTSKINRNDPKFNRNNPELDQNSSN